MVFQVMDSQFTGEGSTTLMTGVAAVAAAVAVPIAAAIASVRRRCFRRPGLTG